MSHRDDLTRSEIRLPTLSTELWNGFIFANFDTDAEPLGPSLAKATDLAPTTTSRRWSRHPEMYCKIFPSTGSPWSRTSWRGITTIVCTMTCTTWCRVMIPVPRPLTSGHMSFEFEPGSGVIARWGRTAHRDRGLNPTQRGLFPPIETLTDEERWHMCYVCVPPILLLGVSTDSAF